MDPIILIISSSLTAAIFTALFTYFYDIIKERKRFKLRRKYFF
jgi:hypothetical protein